jgi:argininosuccinate synthase
MEKIILAYSGGVDTSVAIKLLQEKGFEVITVTVDLGQKENLKEVAERAERLGVSKHYCIDAREEFVRDYIFPAIKANALYEGKYPISSALSRPLIASKLVEVADKEGATAVAHGCTGKGNDQVRFEVTIRALAPELRIVAPIRDLKLTRDKALARAKNLGIPIKASPYSVDENLWGRAISCGPIEVLSQEVPPDAFSWVSPPESSSDQSKHVTIEFKRGVPVSLNGEQLGGVELLAKLNDLAGGHGIGLVDHIEDRVVGFKSREVYECPAATCILEAHKDLEKLVLTRQQLAFKRVVDDAWTSLVYDGLWVDPLREDLEAFIDSTQGRVSGEIGLKLFKGNVSIVNRSSLYSLYSEDLARYDEKSVFDEKSSSGFIDIWGLPSRVGYRRGYVKAE